MKSKLAKFITVIALILVIIILGMLGFGYYKKKTVNISNPIVTMEVENYGTVKIELYPDIAPDTVANFVTLINNGFYNGLTFHRVVKDFMIQGGDKTGDGTGSPTLADLYGNEDENATYEYSNGTEATGSDDYSIKGEFIANGYDNNKLNLTEGTIAMARSDYTSYSPTLASESYDSAGSQFFIMTSDKYTNLSGQYAGFGKVIEGMDVIKKIQEVECKPQTEETEESEGTEGAEESEETEGSESTEEDTDSGNSEISKPVETIKISSMSVDTFGVDYGKPEIIEPFNYMQWIYNLYGLTYSE